VSCPRPHGPWTAAPPSGLLGLETKAFPIAPCCPRPPCSCYGWMSFLFWKFLFGFCLPSKQSFPSPCLLGLPLPTSSNPPCGMGHLLSPPNSLFEVSVFLTLPWRSIFPPCPRFLQFYIFYGLPSENGLFGPMSPLNLFPFSVAFPCLP